MITFQNVSKVYKMNEHSSVALDDASFNIEAKNLFLLLENPGRKINNNKIDN